MINRAAARRTLSASAPRSRPLSKPSTCDSRPLTSKSVYSAALTVGIEGVRIRSHERALALAADRETDHLVAAIVVLDNRPHDDREGTVRRLHLGAVQRRCNLQDLHARHGRRGHPTTSLRLPGFRSAMEGTGLVLSFGPARSVERVEDRVETGGVAGDGQVVGARAVAGGGVDEEVHPGRQRTARRGGRSTQLRWSVGTGVQHP